MGHKARRVKAARAGTRRAGQIERKRPIYKLFLSHKWKWAQCSLCKIVVLARLGSSKKVWKHKSWRTREGEIKRARDHFRLVE